MFSWVKHEKKFYNLGAWHYVVNKSLSHKYTESYQQNAPADV